MNSMPVVKSGEFFCPNISSKYVIENIENGKGKTVGTSSLHDDSSSVVDISISQNGLDRGSDCSFVPGSVNQTYLDGSAIQTSRNQLILDFENSTIRLPNENEKSTTLPGLNGWGMYGSHAVSDIVGKTRREHSFRRSGSIASQGESSYVPSEVSSISLPNEVANSITSFLGPHLGTHQVVMDFENSRIQTTSVRDGVSGIENRPGFAPLINGLGMYGSDAIDNNVWANHCEQFFRRSGSIASQGESSSAPSVEERTHRRLGSSTVEVGTPFNLGEQNNLNLTILARVLIHLQWRTAEKGSFLLQFLKQSRSSGGCIPQDIHTSTNVDGQAYRPCTWTLAIVNGHVIIVVPGSMCPTLGNPPRFLQLYIYDTENGVANRMRHFGGVENDGLEAEIVQALIAFLNEHNELVQLLLIPSEQILFSLLKLSCVG
ncbi:hypothetical protein Tco_1013294 [Tanacetum coccineum]